MSFAQKNSMAGSAATAGLILAAAFALGALATGAPEPARHAEKLPCPKALQQDKTPVKHVVCYNLPPSPAAK